MRLRYSLMAPLAALLMLAPGHLGQDPNPVSPESEPAAEILHIPGAMRAMQFMAGQRAYPGRDLPPSGYTEGFDRAHALNTAEGVEKAGTETWQSLGPHNIGGRTLALAFNPQDPNTIFAGSASGGLWRTRTGGVGVSAWEYVSTGFPVPGVSSIAITPNDSNTIYIGTGEVYSYDNTQGGIADRLTRGSFGIGILKSTDAGQTWHKSLDWSYDQQRGVQVVKIDPTNPGIVWAGTTIGTFKSVDYGHNWNQVDATVMVTDLVIHPLQPNIVVMAAGNLGSPGTGIYRTTDGGASWNEVLPFEVVPLNYQGKGLLSLCESQPDVIYASVANGGISFEATYLVRSEDAGATWTLASNANYAKYQGWFAHDVAVHPEDPSIVITAGIDIWRSTSYGVGLEIQSDWSAWYFGQVPVGGPEGPPHYSHADHHDIVFHPTNRDIVYFANDGGIFRSLDGGLTFEGCNGGYQTQQFYAGFSISQSNPQLAIGGMQDNSTAIFTGSFAWTRVIGGDGSWTGIDAADDQVMYGSAQYLYMLRSRNGGSNWTNVSPPEMGLTSFIAPFVLGGPTEPDVIYAGRSFILKSIDEGTSWQVTNQNVPLDTNPSLALAVSLTNSDVAYATTAPHYVRSGVFRTLDGGDTWQNVTGTLPDRHPVGLAVDPSDDLTVYVTFSGFGTSHVFRSSDGGDSWQDIGAALPDVPTSAVAVDPLDQDNIYVGNDLGVFATVTGGNTWFALNQGLPDAVVAMDLNVQNAERKLVVSTYGNGAYSRPMLAPISGVEEEVVRAGSPVLEANYPNPFNPWTSITFEMPRPGQVRLDVLDLAGRRIKVLHDGWISQGRHAVQWDGLDTQGNNVASGQYLYRLSAGDWVATRKMQLVR